MIPNRGMQATGKKLPAPDAGRWTATVMRRVSGRCVVTYLLAIAALFGNARASDRAKCDWPGVRAEDAKAYCDFRYLDMVQNVGNDPELHAIAKWHRALVTDDFEGFTQIQEVTKYESLSPADVFPRLKEFVPERLIVGLPRMLSTGYSQYPIAGCRYLRALGREVRFYTTVTVRRTPDGLRVFGDSWSMISTQMWDKCPV